MVVMLAPLVVLPHWPGVEEVRGAIRAPGVGEEVPLTLPRPRRVLVVAEAVAATAAVVVWVDAEYHQVLVVAAPGCLERGAMVRRAQQVCRVQALQLAEEAVALGAMVVIPPHQLEHVLWVAPGGSVAAVGELRDLRHAVLVPQRCCWGVAAAVAEFA